MNDLMVAFDRLWRKIQVVRLTASGLVAKRGGYLISAVAYGDGSAVGRAIVYDGEGTNDQILFDLGVYSNGSASYCPTFPVPFDRGLYVSLSGNITSVTLTFITIGSR
jgi:hypothetical protein